MKKALTKTKVLAFDGRKLRAASSKKYPQATIILKNVRSMWKEKENVLYKSVLPNKKYQY